ncbi:hypothetical protein PC128_g15537 [Phytophthora cactorum]|nr:hypothetical protein PC128_g15537 [Phytophthora cactorum]
MISNSTREKAKATKAYLEQKYATMKREREESRERRNTLEQQMAALRLTERKKEQYRQELRSKELQSLRHQRKRLAVGDFQPLAVIGRGAFGEFDYVLNQLQANNPEQCGPQYQELVRQITSNFDEFTEPCELPAPTPVQASGVGHVPPAAPTNSAGRGNGPAAHDAASQANGAELPQAFGPDGKPLTFNKFIGYTYKRKPPVRMALNDGLFDSGAAAVANEADHSSSPLQTVTPPDSYGADANMNSVPNSTGSPAGYAARQNFDGGSEHYG